MKETIINVLQYIWQKRKINLWVFFSSILVLIIIIFFVLEKKYTANVTILPQTSDIFSQLGSGVSALSGLFGLEMGSGSFKSQEMYQEIIHSRSLQSRLLKTEFEVTKDGQKQKMTLLKFLEIKGDSPREIWEKAFKKLEDDVIYTKINSESNILDLKVTLKDPFLAAKVANTIVEYLKEIVKNRLENDFVTQMQYLQKRITTVSDSLKIVEQDLQRFLERTRDLNRPQNVVKQMRLKRMITEKSTIYAELKKQQEIMVLMNVTNLYPVKVLDKAIVPYKKSRPRRALLLIFFGLLILMVQLFVNWLIVRGKELKDQVITPQVSGAEHTEQV